MENENKVINQKLDKLLKNSTRPRNKFIETLSPVLLVLIGAIISFFSSYLLKSYEVDRELAKDNFNKYHDYSTKFALTFNEKANEFYPILDFLCKFGFKDSLNRVMLTKHSDLFSFVKNNRGFIHDYALDKCNEYCNYNAEIIKVLIKYSPKSQEEMKNFKPKEFSDEDKQKLLDMAYTSSTNLEKLRKVLADKCFLNVSMDLKK